MSDKSELTVAAVQAAPVYFDRLRRYGAQARCVLLANAANEFGVPIDQLTTQSSKVCHEETGRCMTYGEIAAIATMPGEMPALDSIPLKDPQEFRLIGERIPRRDLWACPGKLQANLLRWAIFWSHLSADTGIHCVGCHNGNT